MMGTRRSRIERLEQALALKDDGRPAYPAAASEPWFWGVMSGTADPDRLDPDGRELYRAFLEGAAAEHDRSTEDLPAGRLYREELARLGLPQPPTLAGVDVVEECVRLAGVPTGHPRGGSSGG